jgi:hypothetical protein
VKPVPARGYLTDEAARAMTRRVLSDRLYDEMQKWKARPPRTDAQRAAYDLTVRIMHAYIDPLAGVHSALVLVRDGRRDGYWDTPVASLPPLPPAGQP